METVRVNGYTTLYGRVAPPGATGRSLGRIVAIVRVKKRVRRGEELCEGGGGGGGRL